MAKRFFSLLIAASVLLSLSVIPAGARTTTLELNADRLVFGLGEGVRVAATTNSRNPVVWTVSDNTVLNNKEGAVRGVGVGVASLIAAVDGVSAEVSIAVRELPKSITANNMTLFVGERERITINFPSRTMSRNRTFESSNPSVASVARNGTVRAVGAGTATITVTVTGGVSTDVRVTVKPVIRVQHVTVAPGGTVQVPVQLDGNAVGQTLYYESSTTSIATVNRDGVVTGVREGCCLIKVTTANGHRAILRATVQANAPPPSRIPQFESFPDDIFWGLNQFVPTMTADRRMKLFDDLEKASFEDAKRISLDFYIEMYGAENEIIGLIIRRYEERFDNHSQVIEFAKSATAEISFIGKGEPTITNAHADKVLSDLRGQNVTNARRMALEFIEYMYGSSHEMVGEAKTRINNCTTTQQVVNYISGVIAGMDQRMNWVW